MTQTEAKKLADADRYRILLETSRRLSATLSPSELHAAIYDETSAALQASGFYLALHDHSRDLARIVFYADAGEVKHVDVAYRGSDSEVFRTQRGSIVHDDLTDGALLVLGRKDTAAARSAVTAPILFDGRMLGAISAQSCEPSSYSEQDLELLQGIADLAAVAIHNSIQFTELERRRREAEQLEEIGRALTSELDPEGMLDRVINAVEEILSVDGTAVWLCDLQRDPTCRVAKSGGDIAIPIGLEWEVSEELRRSLCEERRPVIFDDLRVSDLPEAVAEHLTGGSAIGVPVIVSGHVEGVLTAGSRLARRFTDEDTAVLQRLANQFAVALGNARLHAELHALSLTDPLTGLPNRRRLQIHLDHEVAAAQRGRPLGIVMIDIDRFKHYNDTLGHLVGDEILKAVGRLLAGQNRAMNIVARYGGDEFVSVLSGSDLEGTRHYADRVQERVADDETLDRHGITLSIGVAAWDPDRMSTVNDVLRAADADMYEVKQAVKRGERAAR